MAGVYSSWPRSSARVCSTCQSSMLSCLLSPSLHRLMELVSEVFMLGRRQGHASTPSSGVLASLCAHVLPLSHR